jgi:sugar phosphate permease
MTLSLTLASLKPIKAGRCSLSGVAMAVAALAPNLPLALLAFTFVGLGENLLVGPEMRLMQEMVAERMLGRVFGLKDVLENIAFVAAFLGAGALLSLAGVRAVFVGAGLVTVALAGVGAFAFRTPRVVAQAAGHAVRQPALETGE